MAQAHKFRKAKSLFSTTLSAGIGTGTGETITLASVTGLPTDTEITITIDRVDSAGTATPNAMERITGIISGSNLISYTRAIDGTSDMAHSSGAVVEYIWNADDLNDLVDGILVGHNQDGTHDFATLYDTNGNELIKTSTTASAVNEITVTNAATGNAPEISATGGDTNIDLKLKGKGTGTVEIYNPTSTAYEAAVGETGWIPAGETWTYASATTFTINGDLTGKYQKGDKIKLTQSTGGVKYWPIINVGESGGTTTITLPTTTTNTLANEAITSPLYSKVENPQGWPDWFAYTPSFIGSTSNPSIENGTVVGRFKVWGKQVHVMAKVAMGSSTTYGSGFLSVTLPITPDISSSPHNQMTIQVGLFDFNALLIHSGFVSGNAERIYFAGGRFQSTVPITLADGDEVLINGTYAYDAN